MKREYLVPDLKTLKFSVEICCALESGGTGNGDGVIEVPDEFPIGKSTTVTGGSGTTKRYSSGGGVSAFE